MNYLDTDPISVSFLSELVPIIKERIQSAEGSNISNTLYQNGRSHLHLGKHKLSNYMNYFALPAAALEDLQGGLKADAKKICIHYYGKQLKCYIHQY